MLLIVAALAEELGAALDLCRHRQRIQCKGMSCWSACSNRGQPIQFLKTGPGPVRSAAKLQRFLEQFRVSRILAVGYAGALDPALKPGDLVIIRRAASLAEDRTLRLPLTEVQISAGWDLAAIDELLEAGKSAGLKAGLGDALTSPHIIGEPGQKRLLFVRFHAAVVDMETAALAAVAASREVPFSCVRAVSDAAGDTFLAPLSYDPSSTPARRALKVASAGLWMHRYRRWSEQAALARESLRRFVARYFDSFEGG